MKITRACSVLIFGALLLHLLGGCAIDAEERAFFYRGWVKPEKGANERFVAH